MPGWPVYAHFLPFRSKIYFNSILSTPQYCQVLSVLEFSHVWVCVCVYVCVLMDEQCLLQINCNYSENNKCQSRRAHIPIRQTYALLLCLRSQKRKLVLAIRAVMLCFPNYVNASWREKLSHLVISSASLNTKIRETYVYYCG
jgi:hypothetical protein